MIVDLTYADGHWEEWSGLFPGFLRDIAAGAIPTRHVDGSYYDVTYSPQGELMLDGCPISLVFTDGCATMSTVIDDRRVQLYNSNGQRVADIEAVNAFSDPMTGDWELWKAYYEAAGFSTGRTGNWEVITLDPGTGEVVTTVGPPLFEIQQAGLTGYIPFILGGIVLYYLWEA